MVVRDQGRWQPFTSFAHVAETPADAETAALVDAEVGRVLREWRRPLLMGEPDAVDRACEIFA